MELLYRHCAEPEITVSTPKIKSKKQGWIFKRDDEWALIHLKCISFSLLLSQNGSYLAFDYRIELIQFGIGTAPVLQVVLIFWSSSNLFRFCHRVTLCWHKCACWVVLDLRAVGRCWIYRWVLFRFDCGFSALVKARFIICWYGH